MGRSTALGELLTRRCGGRLADDIWAWSLEKSGEFSVRSTYGSIISNKHLSESSSTGLEQPHWKKLWKLKIPPKVQKIWWRVMKKFIPCKAVLKERHIQTIHFCETCGRAESIFHVLFECSWAKVFWRGIKEWTGVKIPELHQQFWAFEMVEGVLVPEKDACIILCGCWAAWSERNTRNHGGEGRSVKDSVLWAVETASDLATLTKR